MGAREAELLEDEVELNQDERNQDEVEVVVSPEQVSIDNFAFIVVI